MDPARLQTYIGKAEEYCRLRPGLTSWHLHASAHARGESETLLKVDLHEAHQIMQAWTMNRQMTNYETFEIEAAAMQTDQAMLAKSLFYQADKVVRGRQLSRSGATLRRRIRGVEAGDARRAQDCRARGGRVRTRASTHAGISEISTVIRKRSTT